MSRTRRQPAESVGDVPFHPTHPTLDQAHDLARTISRGDDYSSPFATRVARHIDLDDKCLAFLRRLQSDPIVVPADTNIFKVNGPVRQLYIAQAGCAMSYSILSGGHRHIDRIFLPGDMIGLEDINWRHHTSNVRSVTPVVLTGFTKTALRCIFEDSPRMARTIFSMSMMDTSHLFDRLKAVGRLGARARVAAFMLQMWSRSQAAGTAVEDKGFFLPLTQTEIGDAIGLTNVSVSRAMTALEDADCIRREGMRVRLLDVDRLVRMTDYFDRTLHVDRDWISSREVVANT